MNKVVCVLMLFLLLVVTAPAAVAGSDGEDLYPITCRSADFQLGQPADLRVLDRVDRLPGHFGWVTWDGSHADEDLIEALTPPATAYWKYYNPGTPANGWTPDYSDTHVSVGDWVQGLPGNLNTDDVRLALDRLIATKIPLIVPLYDSVSGRGANAYYHVAAFGAFELQSYVLDGKNPHLMGKFLRWISTPGG